jgi:hypothetical protein
VEGKSTRELTGDWRERVQENQRGTGGKEYKRTNGGVQGKSTRELTGEWRERVQDN